MAKEAHDCAEAFLKDLRAMSPAWELKVQALIEERHFTPAQALGNLAAFALDTDQYLIVSDHPFFREVGIRPAGSKAVCPVCDREYVLDYPGKPLCGEQACAAAYYAKPKASAA